MSIVFIAVKAQERPLPAALQNVSYLVGVWQSEGGTTFERWWLSASGDALDGQGYVMKDGEAVVNEYLRIYEGEEGMFYEATVLNQNGGRAISFAQDIRSDSMVIFTNPHHDFPKKIIYQRLGENRMQVRVSGDSDKEFTVTFSRIRR